MAGATSHLATDTSRFRNQGRSDPPRVLGCSRSRRDTNRPAGEGARIARNALLLEPIARGGAPTHHATLDELVKVGLVPEVRGPPRLEGVSSMV